LRLKIDWISLVGGSKFTVFALFYFVFEGNFPIASPPGAYIWRRDLTEGFLRYRFGGLLFGGAYFRNSTVDHKFIIHLKCLPKPPAKSSSGAYHLEDKSNIPTVRWHI